MLNFTGYDGLLFVGDPHLWSKGPGKRLDRDIFKTVSLNKLEQAVDIAIKHNLYLIILGDLFHVDNENDIDLLTKLARILNKGREPFATIEGNHEKSQTKLSDDVATSLLRDAGAIYTLEENKLWAKFTFKNGKECYVGSTPYGDKIPTAVNLPKKEKNQDTPIIWLTHHDLDFGDSYPGVIPVEEIKGVSMLVNGHIHKTKKSMKLGKMKAHNPGNIIRLSTDCKDHVPSVWMWTPEQDFDLEPIDLIFEKHVFDLIGKQIESTEAPINVSETITPQQSSKFVEKMQQSMNERDPSKTDDGVHVKENIRSLGMAMNLDKEFVEEMLSIAQDTISNL